MKKLWAVFMICAILISGFVLAEELSMMQTTTVDMNGDGADETVSLFLEEVSSDDEDPVYHVKVARADGSEAGFDTGMVRTTNMYKLDLIPGDGCMEILVSGDVLSDDYYTCCVRYDGEKLTPIEFADASRGSINDDSFSNFGYGFAESLLDNGKTLVLSGSQDVLGTWFASRSFTYSAERDRYELTPGELWEFDYDTADPDLWNDRVLELKQDLPVTFTADGSETEGKLLSGEKFLITASDKHSIVYFTTQDGRNGYFPIALSNRGWGMDIYGVVEDDWFVSLPYAD